VWPATVSVGELIFADPMLNPPLLTFVVVWQPEPLQSSEPIGMWVAVVVVIVMFAKVVATAGA
jgi:hypothetical protein